MKHLALRSVLQGSVLACSLVLGACATSHPVWAQGQTVRTFVDVPFAFRSGTDLMPSGQYEIRVLSRHFLLMRASEGSRYQIIPIGDTQAFRAPDQSKLIFHRYGDRYFLYQMWSSGETSGFEVMKGHAEKEVLRAKNHPVPATWELAFYQGSPR